MHTVRKAQERISKLFLKIRRRLQEVQYMTRSTFGANPWKPRKMIHQILNTFGKRGSHVFLKRKLLR